MNKILTVLMIAGLAYGSANAQQTQINSCGIKQHKVCKTTADKKTSCYKTQHAQNFAVCKSDEGYYICCETPGLTNSTFTEYHPVAAAKEEVQAETAATYLGNYNQPAVACGEQQNKVCKFSADKKRASCYKTKNAQNFKVCKNENGYYICCETPGKNNSTFTEFPVVPESSGDGE